MAHLESVLLRIFVLIELFSLGVTAKALRAKIDWKSALCKGWVSIRQIFTQKGTSPTYHFRTD